MKKLILTSLILATSIGGYAAADTISININGKPYVCTGSERQAPPPEPPAQVVSIYCECSPPPLVSLKRIAVMSNGTTTTVSSQPFYPDNGSFNPDEAARNCAHAARQCR